MHRTPLGFITLIVGTLVLAMTIEAAPPGSVNARNSGVFPPNSSPNGMSYAEWSAAWWQWALEAPLEGHPFIDDPDFDCSLGQSGPVWFLAGVFGEVERSCTIPSDKKLFIGLLNVECSSLEEPPFNGETEEEQAACAAFFADFIDAGSLFCTIDGKEVQNIDAYRFTSPQYSFTAPSPWIFGDTGGEGTSVADGYYLMLPPLSEGEHVIRFGGLIPDFEISLDMTYYLTVVDEDEADDPD